MRPGGGHSKGSSFERDVCRKLSLWWSGGTRDDIFWRTAASGARATVRFRKGGQRTAGGSGDVTALDAVGKPFTDRFSVEIKRGYNRWNPADTLDRLPESKPSLLEEFIEQAQREAHEAGVPYWLIIAQRDRRQAVVIGEIIVLTKMIPGGLRAGRCWTDFDVVIIPFEQFLRAETWEPEEAQPTPVRMATEQTSEQTSPGRIIRRRNP